MVPSSDISISKEDLIGGVVAAVLEPTAGAEPDEITLSKKDAATLALTDGIVAVIDNSVSGCRCPVVGGAIINDSVGRKAVLPLKEFSICTA